MLTKKINIKQRGVAQMVARMVRDHKAASSSLATPTKKGVFAKKRPFFNVFLLIYNLIFVT